MRASAHPRAAPRGVYADRVPTPSTRTLAITALLVCTGLALAVACATTNDPYALLTRGYPDEAAAGCRLELSDTPSPLLKIDGRVNLPKGVLLLDEPLDFYKESEVARLAGSPCRIYAIYGWANAIDPIDYPNEYPDTVVAGATGVPRDHITWSEVTSTPTRFSGAYEYRDWYPQVPPRKGWATLRVYSGVAYWFALETNQQYWYSVADILKRSAETAQFTPAMGQGPSTLDDVSTGGPAPD
jgi:hypothetical protein